MHLGYHLATGLMAFGALALPARQASAEDVSPATCARAYEEGQELRKSGQLVAARATLQSCAHDQCPDFIRTDCASWYDEVQSELPTLVFAARSQGRDLSEVRIWLGERVLASLIDGQAVELDPGDYVLRFEARDMRPLKQRFVVARGERNRLIQVELEPTVATVPAAAAPGPDRSLAPSAQRSLLLPGMFAGVGVLGVAGFAGLGAWGLSGEKHLEEACSPRCSASELAEVRTRYLLADVSLGVGLASLSLGAYFYLSQDPTPQTRAPKLAILPRPYGADVVYGGAF
jgi:hypothetical protein